MDFGNRLKQLRKQAGLTQAQLAQQLGVTKSLISFYELQERIPSPEILIKLSKTFHVSADYLLGINASESLDVSGLDSNDVALLRAMTERLRK